MGLKNLSEHIYFLPHKPEVDRPMLAYVKGERFSLAIDAGYSRRHVQDFYRALRCSGLDEPDFTVITHWHYDHTFGLHAINGVSIAHRKTNLFLREQQNRANDITYMNLLKEGDFHFAKEYAGETVLNIVISDMEYTDHMTLHLGNLTAHIFHTVSPHSEDTTCVYISEEKTLFLGDSTSEDFFNGGYMDKVKLRLLMEKIRSIECAYCVLSHCEPLKKHELLAYLDAVKQ